MGGREPPGSHAERAAVASVAVPHPHEALAASPHHRASVYRTDESWLAARWGSPAARAIVIGGARVRPVSGRLDWLPTSRAPEGTRVLLGEYDGATRWAVLVEPRLGEDGWLGLRALLPALLAAGGDQAPLLFHAIGMAEWHRTTRFCARCGGRLASYAAGHELRCTECGAPTFPRTDPAVIMTVVHGEPGSAEEACLLGRRREWPLGRFSTLAGFCEPGESVEDAVRREVLEEVGIRVGEVAYFGNQSWPFPQSLMLGCTARALAREPATLEVEDEIAESRWFTRAELLACAASGEVKLPQGVSISRSLIEAWAGERLPGSW